MSSQLESVDQFFTGLFTLAVTCDVLLLCILVKHIFKEKLVTVAAWSAVCACFVLCSVLIVIYTDVFYKRQLACFFCAFILVSVLLCARLLQISRSGKGDIN